MCERCRSRSNFKFGAGRQRVMLVFGELCRDYTFAGLRHVSEISFEILLDLVEKLGCIECFCSVLNPVVFPRPSESCYQIWMDRLKGHFLVQLFIARFEESIRRNVRNVTSCQGFEFYSLRYEIRLKVLLRKWFFEVAKWAFRNRK